MFLMFIALAIFLNQQVNSQDGNFSCLFFFFFCILFHLIQMLLKSFSRLIFYTHCSSRKTTTNWSFVSVITAPFLWFPCYNHNSKSASFWWLAKLIQRFRFKNKIKLKKKKVHGQLLSLPGRHMIGSGFLIPDLRYKLRFVSKHIMCHIMRFIIVASGS